MIAGGRDMRWEGLSPRRVNGIGDLNRLCSVHGKLAPVLRFRFNLSLVKLGALLPSGFKVLIKSDACFKINWALPRRRLLIPIDMISGVAASRT